MNNSKKSGNDASTKIRKANKKSTGKKDADSSDQTINSAITFLMQIVRGDSLVLDSEELKPATTSQRIAAAQTLLKLQERKAASGNIVDDDHFSSIDIPPRAKDYQEWLDRQKLMQDKLQE